jgi:hypothetical protein
MIISHKHKFIYFANGKAGSETIEQLLKEYDEKDSETFGSKGLFHHKHIPPAIVSSVIPKEIFDNYFKFTFVRNPVDWFVSQYKWRWRFLPRKRLSESIGTPAKFVSVAITLPKYYKNSKKKIFTEKEVLEMHETMRLSRGLPMSRTLYQSNYAYDVDGNKIIDFVGKLENFNEDISKICEIVGIELPEGSIKKKNASKNRSGKEQVTDEAKKKIFELWKKDFENFNYPKPDFK